VNNRIAILRKLFAKYWQPFILLVTGVPGILNFLKLAEIFDGRFPLEEFPLVGTSNEQNIIRSLIFFGIFFLVRFPKIAVLITRIIMGRPEAPPNLSRMFRGLRAFNEEDCGKLPGRQKEIDDCLRDIRNKRFYILEGESGCGKSSILNAELLPGASGKFQVVKCRVADDPLGKLLAALQDKTYSRLSKTLTKKTVFDALTAPVQNLQNPAEKPKPLLVCIDQFEEMFVTVPDKERAEFLKILKEAIENSNLHLVIAIRSDFRDLLDKACREADPKQTVLNLSNYYILESFNSTKAREVVLEILKPFYKDDPILQQESDSFANALVDELLRPPRDKRLSRNDEKTVLPVELQTIGFMLESTSANIFSARKQFKKSGKIAIMGRFIEDAKNDVWRSTGVEGKDSLLILQHLISPAQTKWAKSARAISKDLNLPEALVERVLQCFYEKYLVNRLPGSAMQEGSTEEQNGFVYELMHEHLIQILLEAPDPVLQKARDAKERLRFWVERAGSGVTETVKKNFLAKFTGYFKMPVPLFETFKLWRYADRRNERNLLKFNLRGFVARMLLIVLPIAGWTYWTHTDIYQIKNIFKDAPAKINETVGGNSGVLVIFNYLKMLVKLDKEEQALTTADKISDALYRSSALSAIATEFAKIGKTDLANKTFDDALTAAEKISDYNSRRYALVAIATEFAKIGKPELADKTLNKALSAAEKISDDDSRSYALFDVATEFAKIGNLELALTTAEKISDDDSRSSALLAITTEFAKIGKTDLALTAALEISDADSRSSALIAIATEFAKIGNSELADKTLNKALTAALEISDADSRSYALHAVATKFAKIGKSEEALTAADKISDAFYRYLALNAITTEFVKIGNSEMADKTLKKALTAAEKISEAHYRSLALITIATKFAKIGISEMADKILNKALSTADTIRDDRALIDIATKFAKIGNSELADKTLNKALTVALEISDGHSRYTTLIDIATEFAKIGKSEEALTTAEKISDDRDRSSALRNIITEFANTKSTKLSAEVMEKALSSCLKIADTDQRSPIMAGIAAGFAHLGNFRKARQIANMCKEPQDALAAYTAILQASFDKKHPELQKNDTISADSSQALQNEEWDY